MAKIRKITFEKGAYSSTSFHGFNVDSEGNLVYTKASSGDLDIQDADQIEQYVMYEVGVVGSTYVINEDGELVIEYETED
jgi:hypothetical protein